jgi:tetratricopeptide (TPR) repeat protein
MAKRSKHKKAVVHRIAAKSSDAGIVAPQNPSWFRRDWLWGLILLLAVIAAYSPVWWAGYIWDDDAVLTNNPVIVGPSGLEKIWTTNAADICPLTLTTFWLEYQLWGLAPLPYHLVNVLLHGASAIVLWRVLRRLRVPGAWLGAALWALHPVTVESVAWITEMKNTESGLFFLLSLLFFVKDLETTPTGKQGPWNTSYALTILFAALAMAAKSSTVILPIVLCLCAWWVQGRWQWRTVWKVAPIFLMSLAAGIVSIWTQKIRGADDAELARSWLERVSTAGDAAWFYLGKLAWPHPLIMVYPKWQIDTAAVLSYVPVLAVVIALVFFWLKRRSWGRPWFFAFACFLAALLPVAGLLNMRYFVHTQVADHFQYLAAMGLLALAGAGIVRLAQWAMPQRTGLPATVGAGLLLLLGTVSWQRAWVYQDEMTLWTETLAVNPNSFGGYNNLGSAFLQQGQVDEAIRQYRKALKIKPNFEEAYNNLGSALSQQGHLDEAIQQYRTALKINANDGGATSNLGYALFQKGQVDEAIQQYQIALKINPNFADPYNNLGNALLQKGQIDEAIRQYRIALKINPNNGAAYNDLGYALFQKGQVDEAIPQYRKALEIKPDLADANNNLGNALFQKGQVDEAIQQYRIALNLNPNFAEAYNNLGRALLQKGQMDEAVAQFQEALRLKPDNASIQRNLSKAQAMARQAHGLK